jgi:16S rRNA G966 N2-methylase RsmD
MALRPSSDRLRETLLNILGPDVEESIFVDLFAGSGAVGVEALMVPFSWRITRRAPP